MAAAAQQIVASPGAIIGSIGVISVRPVLEQLLSRVGVGVNVNKSGQFKDMGALWREATPEEQQKMQELIDDTYSNFLAIVAQARGMDQDAVRELATGEVYLADRARDLGLVDELGTWIVRSTSPRSLLARPAIRVPAAPQGAARAPVRPPWAESMVEAVTEQVELRMWHGRLGL